MEEAPDNAPPFHVDAIVLDEDTGLVLTADFNIKDGEAHPIRIMTDLHDFEPATPGTVVVKGRYPCRLLAIVHDFDREPACREVWIRGSLRAALRLCAERGTTAVGFQLLGTRYGPFSEQWFKEELRDALAESPVPSLRRIWLMLPDSD
ncbi:MAG: hypothetical protein HKO62_00720 [Gammaproteobacteria bacterium]|nr:hypothetical protein [Gammaproteobacteria bacterium]NNL99238.1 hypothetical protein [Gammaproteobacteria bacterium]